MKHLHRLHYTPDSYTSIDGHQLRAVLDVHPRALHHRGDHAEQD